MLLSEKYHAIFDYKLVRSDFPKWRYKTDPKGVTGITNIKSKQRLQREKCSVEKLKIAKRASKILERIPTIRFVGITGSLAMMNSNKDSDIDLIIITKNNSLWTTRLLVYLSFVICHLSFRRPFDNNQKDALCLNIWLDESDLVWNKTDRNLYTAHEIAQIVPLFNKDQTYEKFIWQNRWIVDFWPNAVKIVNSKLKIVNSTSRLSLFEKLAFKIQYLYMRNKISREVVTPTRALFHPQDWGKIVLSRLAS